MKRDQTGGPPNRVLRAQQVMTPSLVDPAPTFTVHEVEPVEIELFDTVAA